MSTSANAPGEPGRDRDEDAVDPADAQPVADDDAASDADRTGSKGATGGGTGAGDGAAVPSGRDVTKKVRREARESEAAARTGGAGRAERKPARKTTSSAVPGREGKDLGFFARIALFVRQVISEIRKVVTPSRNELITFSVVVIVFILAMMAYVGALDYAIGRLVLWVFGN